MSNRIEFWFKDRTDDYRRLPVNPESVEIDSPFGLETVNIDGLGEVAIAGERGLKTITISSFFPKIYNPSYCEYKGYPSPPRWVALFEKWRDTRRNVRIIITGTEISIPVFIEEFTIEPERAGHPGDIFYSMTLREYRPLVAREIVTTNTKQSSKTPKQAQSARSTSDVKKQSKTTTHTVAKGESLSLIAKRYYGSTSNWRRIYDANKKTIGKNPDEIKAGQKLVIPV